MKIQHRNKLRALLAGAIYLCSVVKAANSPSFVGNLSSMQSSAAFVSLQEAYNVNLARSDVYWGTVLSNKNAPFDRDNGILSAGPYYIDTNHREGALLVGPLVLWVNGHTNSDSPHVPIGRVDLRNTTLRFNLSFDHKPVANEFDPRIGGRLVFWFQAKLRREAVAGGDYEMPGRAANYFYTKNLLNEAIGGKTASVHIVPDLNQWSCLGSNPIDLRPIIGSAAKYTCALDQEEFSQAMAEPANMGFVFLLPPRSPDGANLPWLNASTPTRTLAMGNSTFALREFSILKDDEKIADDTYKGRGHAFRKVNWATPQ